MMLDSMPCMIMMRQVSASSQQTFLFKQSKRDGHFLGGFDYYVHGTRIQNQVQFLIKYKDFRWRSDKIGMSLLCSNYCWKAPVIRDHSTSASSTDHKQKFFAVKDHPRICRISATAASNDMQVSLNSHLQRMSESCAYSEMFVIRCYEVGINRRASIETVAKLLQETACNHARSVGFSTDGFATTPSMRKRRLIWVTVRMHLEMEEYPIWGEEVEIETWFQEEGRVGTRRDWLIRNVHTQQIIGRATSTWVTMNQDSRRLSRITDDIRADCMPFTSKPPRWAFPDENPLTSFKIPKLADSIHSLLKSSIVKPRKGDLDMNEHVNNVTYIGWMLESIPAELLDKYDLYSITLEFKRECKQDDIVESITRSAYSTQMESEYDNPSLAIKSMSKTALINGSSAPTSTIFSVNGLPVDCINGFSTQLPDLKDDKDEQATVSRSIKRATSGLTSVNSVDVHADENAGVGRDSFINNRISSAARLPFLKNKSIQFVHLLRLTESNIELNRGWSEWRLKTTHNGSASF